MDVQRLHPLDSSRLRLALPLPNRERLTPEVVAAVFPGAERFGMEEGWPAGRPWSSLVVWTADAGWPVRAEVHDFQRLEIIRATTQDGQLQDAAKEEVTHRVQHGASGEVRCELILRIGFADEPREVGPDGHISIGLRDRRILSNSGKR